jgi:hypothetical protein
MQIWSCILKKYPKTELTQKQIYMQWAKVNEGSWWLDDEQLQSACTSAKVPKLCHM